jgi:hypothetical protein
MITLTAHDLMEVCLKYIPHSDTNVKVWAMEIDYFQCTAGEYFIEGSISRTSRTKTVRVMRPKKSKRYFNATINPNFVNVYNADVETAREVKVNKGFDKINDVMEYIVANL